MKKSGLVFSVITLFTLLVCWSGCDDDDSIRNCHRPEGNIITSNFMVQDVDEIVMEDFGDFVISQGPQEDLVVRTYSNIMDLVDVREVNDRLEIDLPGCYTDVDVLDYDIVMPDLEYFECSGVVNLSSGNSFDLDQLQVVISGTANVSLEGRADLFDVTISGVGNFNCFDFEVEECKIVISGAADIEIHVLDKLDVTISGAGNVYYIGDPVVTTNISGTGNIVKVE